MFFKMLKHFDSLVKYRSIWGERQINLDKLDHFVFQNLKSRKWLPLYYDLVPPLATLIREFYSNLSAHSNSFCGHYLTTWF